MRNFLLLTIFEYLIYKLKLCEKLKQFWALSVTTGVQLDRFFEN